MKNIKILIASCLMLVCAANLSAQWRFGMEYNHAFATKYYYDSDDSFNYKEMNYIGGISVLLTAEYILPRKWTPNWMVLSIRGQFGEGGFLGNTEFSDYFTIDGNEYNDNYSVGLMIPIDVELKLLLSNNCRFFINGGLPNLINFGEYKIEYAPGYEFGVGFEFGFFRIGYKNVNLNKSFFPGNIGNKYNNQHTLTGAFVFNGNRFLKKKSTLKLH